MQATIKKESQKVLIPVSSRHEGCVQAVEFIGQVQQMIFAGSTEFY